MKNILTGRIIRQAALAGLTALTLAAPAARAEDDLARRIYAGPGIDAEELQEMRGGFIGPSGVLVRFGFDIATHVNGALAQRLVLAPTDIGVNTTSLTVDHTDAQGQTTQRQLGLTPTAFRDSVNGGATTISTALSSRGIVSAIQNQANNQLVQRTARIDLDVRGLRNVISSRSSARFVSNGLGARSVLGR
jgi:hypothetical protein